MKSRLKILFLAAALLPLSGPAAAQTVSFKLTPPGEKPRLAEPFTVRVELTVPAPWSVSPDTAAFSDEFFSLLEVRKVSETAAGGVKTELYDLKAAAFDIGVSTFPETAWTLTGGGEEKQAKSPAFNLEIQPLFDTKNAQGGIRDIVPPFKFTPWPLILALLAAAAAAAWYFYRRYRAAPAAAGAQADAPPDDRTPYEKAADALKELSASGLWAEGRLKEFYSALSGIFRNYLDAQFGVKAELMTTNDITRELRRTGAEIKTVIRTRELLENADLVKFAKFRPGEGERDAAVSALGDILSSFNAQVLRGRPGWGQTPAGPSPAKGGE